MKVRCNHKGGSGFIFIGEMLCEDGQLRYCPKCHRLQVSNSLSMGIGSKWTDRFVCGIRLRLFGCRCCGKTWSISMENEIA